MRERYNIDMKEVTSEEFEKLVSEAIDHIPEQYSSVLEEVVFKVEEQPSKEQRVKLGLRDCDALFGLYEGVPRTKRNGQVHMLLPDIITIFKFPMIQMFPDKQSLKQQIYETVWHEVAHYFGLNHEQIHAFK